jgi:hypothetical protein
LHKTIEDEDDDEYEDDFGALSHWHVSGFLTRHGLRSTSGGPKALSLSKTF